ncbi:hypothetical protein BH11ARM1_BH11ARM1_11020 [soil metagenome]
MSRFRNASLDKPSPDLTIRQHVCPGCNSMALHCGDLSKLDDSVEQSSLLSGVLGLSGVRDWLRSPSMPRPRRSKLHQTAMIEGFLTPIAPILFFGIVGTIMASGHMAGIYWAGLIGASAILGVATYVRMKMAAVKEDLQSKAHFEDRLTSWERRSEAYDNIYFCWNCTQVHNAENGNTGEWYQMVDLLVGTEPGEKNSSDTAVL